MLDEKTHPLVLLDFVPCITFSDARGRTETTRDGSVPPICAANRSPHANEFLTHCIFFYFDALPEQQKKSILARFKVGRSSSSK